MRQRTIRIVLIVCGLLTAAVVHADTDMERKLHEVILDAVSARNGFPEDQIELTVRTVRFPERCAHADRIRIAIPLNDDAVGPVTVRAIFEGPSGVIASVPVPLRVRVFADVVVARNRLKRQTAVRPDDVQIHREEITAFAHSVFAVTDSVIGRWPTRTMQPGQIVDQRNIVAAPMVKRGDRVTLLYEIGLVRVTTTALAMEHGYKDQTIRVKKNGDNKLLSAIVLDENTVRPTTY